MLGLENLSDMRNMRCPHLGGCLSMEISGNSIGTITICRLERGGCYREVSVEGGSTVVVLLF